MRTAAIAMATIGLIAFAWWATRETAPTEPVVVESAVVESPPAVIEAAVVEIAAVPAVDLAAESGPTDAAIKGLDSCIGTWGYADEPALDACTWTVLQQIGITDASRWSVLEKSSSEASRRKALEAAEARAEAEARLEA